MNIVFKMMPDGGFVAGDRDSEMTSYAYPSSPHAIVAKKYPKLVAEEMLASERSDYRKIPAIQDYDAANWRKLAEEECGKCGGTGEICYSSTSYGPCPECSKVRK